ncbi:YopX family protein [Streptococcus intermedius]|uniref:YopX family protein n=1 Tax=Streptococcus intermedius TaxID=1338 RepID=UPI000F66F69A|nr:YopX family protein [Streptococcus intermedius]RSJ20044.1 YopX protein [Streptococcus intermedius]
MIPKFRGRSTVEDDKGKWVYGHLLIDNKRALIINRIIEANDEYVSIGDWCSIDMKTIGQSTGVFDRNGTEIFEGDIIDTTDYEGGLSSVGNPLVKVERDKYGFVVTGDFPTSPITLKEFEAGRKFAGVEVIIAGNIYENPELVEVIDD